MKVFKESGILNPKMPLSLCPLIDLFQLKTTRILTTNMSNQVLKNGF
jgi:hypothetical protein